MSNEGISKWLGSGRDRRQHERIKSPRLTLRIESQKYRTLDWSLGGFRIGPFHRRLGAKETLTGTIESMAGLLRETFEADITRITEEGDVCCRFLVLPKAVLKAMAKAGSP